MSGIELQEFGEPLKFNSAMDPAPMSIRRAREDSWRRLPQAKRGITLQEILMFYESEKDWLEELRWRCSSCHQSALGQNGPCISCGGMRGNLQMRNLYEVCEHMIKPACVQWKISYVELLDWQRTRKGGVSVDTFVSHWWGEEFSKFARSLQCYAEARCSSSCRVTRVLVCMSGIVAGIFFSILTTPFCAEYGACPEIFQMLVAGGEDISTDFSSLCWVMAPAQISVVAFTMILCAWWCNKRWQRNPLEWSFWICAFANNQYELQHALGEDGDVYTSSFAVALQAESCQDVVAILDASGVIYQRIWCAFELFFVAVVLPRRQLRRLPVLLVNETGVLSVGDGRSQDIQNMQNMMSALRTHEANASTARDKDMIEQAMKNANTTYEDLDNVLRDIASCGIEAMRQRALAPFLLSVLAPLSSYTSLLLLDSFLTCKNYGPLLFAWSGYRDSFRKLVVMQSFCVMILLFTVLVAFGLFKGLCCRHLRNDEDMPYRRVIRLLPWLMVPTLGSWAIPFFLVALDDSRVILPFYFMVYGHCSKGVICWSILVVCALGAPLGLVYSLFRDFRFMHCFRSRENALFL